MFLTMPNQTAAANFRPVHCMMPPANPADRPDPVSALRREMKLVLVEQNMMRIELNQRRAAEDELREAKEFILAYVERVEQLSVIEAEARKAMEFWRREAERMAQERPRYSRGGGTIFSASRAVWSHWAHIFEQGLARLLPINLVVGRRKPPRVPLSQHTDYTDGSRSAHGAP
jgi:hypothetical protein